MVEDWISWGLFIEKYKEKYCPLSEELEGNRIPKPQVG